MRFLLLQGRSPLCRSCYLRQAQGAFRFPHWASCSIGPTIQFLLGVLVYGEPFTVQRFIGFAFVWVAMVVFLIEGRWQRLTFSHHLRNAQRAVG